MSWLNTAEEGVEESFSESVWKGFELRDNPNSNDPVITVIGSVPYQSANNGDFVLRLNPKVKEKLKQFSGAGYRNSLVNCLIDYALTQLIEEKKHLLVDAGARYGIKEEKRGGDYRSKNRKNADI